MGIKLKDDDVTLRCNFVTLSQDGPYESKTMLDYSAGDIPTEDAEILISFLQEKLGEKNLKFYAGNSYRHCLVVSGGVTGHDLTPPHDISDKSVYGRLPKGENGEFYADLMKRSFTLLKEDSAA